MINEEYSFDELSEYLFNNIDLLIVGEETQDDRSFYFFNLWKSKNKDILVIKNIDNQKIKCSIYNACDYASPIVKVLAIRDGLKHLFSNDINLSNKNVLVDLSSIDHISIMVLTKVLILSKKPKSLFASYIRPKEYEITDQEMLLSENIGEVACVPTFVRRETSEQTLCAFVGFEGLRLKNIIENMVNVSKFRPIVAFPSGTAEWYNITMWNNMDSLKSYDENITISKCLSESIFEAIKLLNTILKEGDDIIIAPLGTRPHTMAAAIYACKNPKVRLIYDYVEEKDDRSRGIDYINIYHLSHFLCD